MIETALLREISTHRPTTDKRRGKFERRSSTVQNSGFTLLEVLVALIILGLSFLGIGRLMMGTVKATDSAYMRTQATILASAILDNMRANRTAALANGYNVGWGTTGYSQSTNCYASSPSSSFNAAQIATCDIAQWKYQLSSSGGVLPNGDGKIETSTSTNGTQTNVQVTISVRWDDSRAASTFNSSNTNYSSQPQTIQLITVL